MTSLAFETETLGANPLDMIEQNIFEEDWPVIRTADDELVVTIKGNWCDFQISINWRAEMSILHYACAFDAGISKKGMPVGQEAELYILNGMINEQLMLGHFDMWRNESAVVFRHSQLLHGSSTSAEQCECLVQIAVDACEKYYPAFQFVLWAGRTAKDALAASVFETKGQA